MLTIRPNLLPFALSIALAALPFSVKFCHAALIGCIACWILEGGWARKWKIIKTDTSILLLMILLSLMLVGIGYSENTSAGWFALERKVFFFIMPVVITTSSGLAPKNVKQMLTIFSLSCVAAATICLAGAGAAWYEHHAAVLSANPRAADLVAAGVAERSSVWSFISYIPLAAPIRMHPTYLGMYCAFALLFLMLEMTSATQKRRRLLGGVVVFLAVFISLLSSKIILVVLVSILILTLYHHSSVSYRRIAAVPAFALLIILGVGYFNPVSHYRNVNEVADTALTIRSDHTYSTSTEIRASLWWLGIQAWKHTNWWIGGGTGDVNALIRKTADRYRITNILNNFNPHNQFIYILVGNGLLAFVPFVLYLFFPLARALRTHDVLLTGFIVIIGMVCMTETVLELQKGIIFFSLFHPALSAKVNTAPATRKPEPDGTDRS